MGKQRQNSYFFGCYSEGFQREPAAMVKLLWPAIVRISTAENAAIVWDFIVGLNAGKDRDQTAIPLAATVRVFSVVGDI